MKKFTLDVTACFTQSRTKGARLVGFWWKGKFKQENIKLFFWGSLNWYKLEMGSDWD